VPFVGTFSCSLTHIVLRQAFFNTFKTGSDHTKQFDSSLLSAGEDGGTDAANALKSAIFDHIQQRQPENVACDIIVRVYANFDILAADVNSAGDTKADKMKIVSAFAQGFSSTHSLFDFINIAPRSKSINKVYGKSKSTTRHVEKD
jgi:hypothetical protein